MDGWRGRLTRELERRGLEMKEVSLSAGLGESYVRDALKRGRGKFENLRKIAIALGKHPGWLVDDVDPETLLEAGAPTPNTRLKVCLPATSLPAIPIYGHAIAGEDGRFVLNGELIGTAQRPVPLADVTEAYGVIVSGDSMLPRYRPGEICLVDPNKPFRRTDDVVVQLEPDNPGDAPDGFIKEFVSLSESTLVLWQHNPPRTIRSSQKIVRTIHLVVGSLRA